ncbi:hypothetical protein ANN_06888 [Periplaneta americana]|uniref:DUF4371 domain-containing protein n=1 Tax=Periplaneta americana TaxID=6978 RepID=A0ABQ8TEW0_PERAM|nr:hypothetical protein ANN_06888 [Periplaneta americana]
MLDRSLPSKETLRGHSDSSFRGEGYIQCCVGVRLCDMYSNQELAEMHFMYGKADGNGALARRLYQERGRPRSTTPEVREEILEAVNMTPSISTRRVALQVNVPHTTVWRLLKEYQLYPYHLQRVQALSPADYPAQVRFCQWFLQQCGVNPNFPALVLFTDEAPFTRDGITNFHNQHVWAYENPRATVPSHHQLRFSLNMWAGIIGDRLVGPHVLVNRLTGQAYTNTIPHVLEDTPLINRQHIHFLHDGAPVHFSRTARRYLDRRFPDRWIGRGGPIAWPPRSPDLNPLDFYLWGHLKSLVYSCPVPDLESLRNRIVACSEDIGYAILLEFGIVFAEQVSGEVCVENDCVIEGLLKVPFNRRTYNEKVEIVKVERPTPELNLSMNVKEKQREYTRHFTSTSYVSFLGKQELAFRDHNESVESDNIGNYIEYLSSLSEFDHLLANHLESSTVFRGTSPAIQNYLIFAISWVMIKNIKSEIEEAHFVAIVVDETSDCSNQSQLSTVLRYIDSTANVQERFIGFTNVSSDKTAAAFFQHVEGVIAEYNVGNKLIAQTYDGASVMAGNINGLKTKVQEKYPQALFVHCYSHVLNLVLQQTTSSIPECRIYFKTLSGLAAFFSSSPKRSEKLKEFMKKKLPKIAPTRWNFTSRLVDTVKEYREQLTAFFENIICNDSEENWDDDDDVIVQMSKKKKKKGAALVNSEYFQSPLRVAAMLHDACACTSSSGTMKVFHICAS